MLFPSNNMAARVEELEDSIAEVYQHSKVNRKEMGRLEGNGDMFLQTWLQVDATSESEIRYLSRGKLGFWMK